MFPARLERYCRASRSFDLHDLDSGKLLARGVHMVWLDPSTLLDPVFLRAIPTIFE
jgi:hypothetical protein